MSRATGSAATDAPAPMNGVHSLSAIRWRRILQSASLSPLGICGHPGPRPRKPHSSRAGGQAGSLRARPAGPLECALVDEGGAGSAVYLVILGIAAVLAIVGVITRPFLFEPIAALLCVVSTRQTPNPRYTGAVAFLIVVCFFVGAAIAASGSHPLY